MEIEFGKLYGKSIVFVNINNFNLDQIIKAAAKINKYAASEIKFTSLCLNDFWHKPIMYAELVELVKGNNDAQET